MCKGFFSISCLFFKKINIYIVSVQLCSVMLPLPQLSEGSGWPLCDSLLCSRFSKLTLNIPSFTTSRSRSCRGRRAAEFPPKLAPLCRLPAPPALPPFLLSFLTLLLDSFLCLPLVTPPLFPFYIPSCSLLPIGFSYS